MSSFYQGFSDKVSLYNTYGYTKVSQYMGKKGCKNQLSLMTKLKTIFLNLIDCTHESALLSAGHRENRENVKKISLSGKAQEIFGNFAQTQGKHREFCLLKL